MVWLLTLNNARGWTHKIHVSELHVYRPDDTQLKFQCTQPEPTNFNGMRDRKLKQEQLYNYRS